jgi:hypothetical protein
MKRLKNKYQGKRAIVVLGGPSLVARKYDFTQLKKNQGQGHVIFLESKAFTPEFIKSGVMPDYLFMPFPETIKGNALHFFIYRSFLARTNTKYLFKKEYQSVYSHMEECFDDYFKFYRPEKALNKRYIWNQDAFLKGSTYDLLQRHPEVKLITNGTGLKNNFPNFTLKNEVYSFELDSDDPGNDLSDYFHPIEKNDEVILRATSFLNSMAISFYPLVHYMGMRDVYLVGMDMSMLGTMEYGAPFVFKSMLHFYWYFLRVKKTFNATYKMNFPIHLRPKSEFEDARKIFKYKGISFNRVSDEYKYFSKFDGINHLSFDEFNELMG